MKKAVLSGGFFDFQLFKQKSRKSCDARGFSLCFIKISAST